MRHSGLFLVIWVLGTSAIAGEATTPPPGAEQFLAATADGVQIYACADKGGTFVWSFQAPEAALFDAKGRQIGTHAKGPSWTLDDGSSVSGEVIAKEPAPESGTIPWLLLAVKSRGSSGALSRAAFVRRIDTKGGVEPSEVCDAAHEGAIARMRYSATYQFFAK